jgi:phenylacetate-CoA ligase
MDDVTTKAEDTLTLKDGRLIPPSVLTHPFKPLNSIEESQIIQKDYDRIVVKIVRRQDYTDRDTQHLVRELKSRVGEDTAIEIEFVEGLPRTAAGKFRWVVSEVPLGI